MADDSPFPPDKRGKNPASLGNLRPAQKGEPSRNPSGKNGRTRAETVANFLDDPEDTDIGKTLIRKLGLPENTPRIIAVLHRELLAALGKSDLARKTLIEQYGGKARIQMDLTSSDGSMTPGDRLVTYRIPDNGRGPVANKPGDEPIDVSESAGEPSTGNDGRTNHD